MELFRCRDQHLVLHPSRVIYWEEQAAMILSDLHFGKSGHFRKEGIAVPQAVFREDLQRLVTLIQYFQPRQLIIAGDLFHSRHNQELDLFAKWRNDLRGLDCHLVMGNHDILPEQWYSDTGIITHRHSLRTGPFLFCHDPETISATDCYSFTGHIHPGVTLYGIGKQSLRFPCFHFTSSHCVLPAFSRFTGTYRIRPDVTDQVYAIVNDKLVKVDNI